MPLLTEHFSESELRVALCEDRVKDNARFLCKAILEPLRAHYNKPITINSGYRNPDHNKFIGGKEYSWHLYQDGHAAVDLFIDGEDITKVFDYIRLESKLPFDKAILELNKYDIPQIVHFQVDKEKPPRRKAYIGHTGAATSYKEVEVT